MTHQINVELNSEVLRVQSIALGMMCVGLGFAYFGLLFNGVDLLIDAVGYLLVFNALRALKKIQHRFAGGDVIAGILTVVALAQLFVYGTMLFFVMLIRGILELVLYIVLFCGLASTLKAVVGEVGRRVYLAIFLVCALGCGCLYFAALLWPVAKPAIIETLFTIFCVALVICLAWGIALTEMCRERLLKNG